MRRWIVLAVHGRINAGDLCSQALIWVFLKGLRLKCKSNDWNCAAYLASPVHHRTCYSVALKA
jgi:hypothetical protein